MEKQNDDDEVKVEKQVGYKELPFMGHYEKVKPAKKPPSMKKYRDLDGDYVPSGHKRDREDREYVPRGLSDAKPGQLRKCTFCSNQYDKTSNMKNHTLNHFMAKLNLFFLKTNHLNARPVDWYKEISSPFADIMPLRIRMYTIIAVKRSSGEFP